MLSPGERIGDWVVDDVLGEGGMGAVYACHNVLSARIRAAVKVLKPHELGQARERFVREVELLAELQHPAVVRVLGGGEDMGRGLLYMAMELLEGDTLEQRLARGPLSWSEACRIFEQLGSGLLHAHRKGVVHRDIKPQNVMLCADGQARLLDFGIAVQEGATRYTRDGLVPGTLSYMAPEVFAGEKPDHRADIYALGQLLWETLTGASAFPEDADSGGRQNIARIMGSKLQSQALDPGPAFPEPLRTLVQQCTDPKPASRLHDLASFVKALQETGEHPLGAGPPGVDGAAKPSGVAQSTLAPALTWDEGLPGDELLAPELEGHGKERVGPTLAPTFSQEDRTPHSASPTLSPAVTRAPQARPPRRRSALGLVMLGVVGLGALCALGSTMGVVGLALMGEGMDFDSGMEPGFELPDITRMPSLTQGEVPPGLPFSVTSDAQVMYGAVNETDGQKSWVVTYTTRADGEQLAANYEAQFAARNLELSRSTTTTAEGVSYSLVGYSSAEAATANVMPNPMSGGLMVSVSWTPLNQ